MPSHGPSLSRRTLLGGFAGATTGLVAGAIAAPSAFAAARPISSKSAIPQVSVKKRTAQSPTSSGCSPAVPVDLQTKPSSALADIVGVTAVTSSSTGIWGNDDIILARLTELGLKHVRTGIFTGNRRQVTRMQNMAAKTGIRFNTIMGDPTMSNATPEELVNMVATDLSGIVSTVEGPNEWNLAGGTNWASDLRAYQARLYAAAKANPLTSSIPVLAPALGARTGFTELGDISKWCDQGNIHLYQGGFCPGYRASDIMDAARTNSGPHPIAVTETGWHNAILSTSTHRYTSELAAGLYAPRVFLDYFQRGATQVYVHELVDEPDDVSMTDFEAHFGLLHSDFTPKPAFTSIRNLLRLLDTPPATAAARQSALVQAASAPAPHAFTTTTPDLRSVVVSRADGSWVVFVWRDTSIWDVYNKVMVSATALPVSLKFNRAVDVSVSYPGLSSSVSPLAVNTLGTTLQVAGDVTALVVTPR